MLKRKDYQPLVDIKEKVRRSIERIQQFQNKDVNHKTILAFSGGKDSLAVYILAVKSGIEFTPVYSQTSMDPPELIYYIRKTFNPWCREHGYPEVIFAKYPKWKRGENKGKIKTIWSVYRNRAIPATRNKRYCCEIFKERTGNAGDTVLTGVRWEESSKRSKQSMVNFWKGKIMVRPVIDWLEVEIWSLILQEDVPYCCKYDQGWNRIGCIGCPLSSNQVKELEEYPKYKANYIRAFDGMIEYRKTHGYDQDTTWKTGEDIYKWWIGECKAQRKEIDGQCSMF